MKSLQEQPDFVAIGAEAVTFSPSKQQSAGLPDPDLTPSLNPTLARNLGRWAEVYFTTPPEQRDQAVQELLRELLAEEQKRLGRWRPSTTSEEPARIQATDGELYTVPAEVTPFPEPAAVPEAREKWPESGSVPIGSEMSGVAAPLADANVPSPAGVEEISRIVRPLSGNRPGPRPWGKLAVLAAGVLLCAGLFYAIGNRTGQEEGDTRQVPAGGKEAQNKPQPTALAPSGIPRPSPGKPFTKSAHRGVVQPAATRQTETLPAPTAKQVGAQEVTTADPYRTADGVSHDSAQRARSLWQEVGKQNVNALERLSAMYARGEGVARDCDQARVLAGAAAQKNPKGAASLLQELQAAGCE